MEIINILKDKGFMLCGSRYFAEKYPDYIKIKKDTDWDFFGKNTYANKEILQDLGFYKVSDVTNYADDLAVSFWKHELYKIDVILRRKCDTYKRFIENISPHEYCLYLWKSSPVFLGDKPTITKHFNRGFAFYAAP